VTQAQIIVRFKKGIVKTLGHESVNPFNSLQDRVQGKILMNVLMDRWVGSISRLDEILSAFLGGLCHVE
jgi:hypothetical protein